MITQNSWFHLWNNLAIKSRLWLELKYKEILMNSSSVSPIEKMQDQGLWLLVLIFWVEKVRTWTICKGHQKQTAKEKKMCLWMGSFMSNWRSTWLFNSKIFQEGLVWMSSWFGINFCKNQKERKIKDKTRNSTNQNICSFSHQNNQASNIEAKTQQKKNQDRQILIFFLFFLLFFLAKQPKTNKQTKQRRETQSKLCHSLLVSLQNKINESASKNINFNLFETVIDAIGTRTTHQKHFVSFLIRQQTWSKQTTNM